MLQLVHEIPAPAPQARVIAELTDRLRAQAGGTGGWPYYPGRSSRLEPTYWVLSALPDLEAPELGRLGAFLERCRRADGLFVDHPGPPNFAHNAMMLLALLERPTLGGAAGWQGLHAALLSAVGLRTGPSPAIRQDNRLEGWSWIDGTFSWVEPTAWCVLALKRAAGRDIQPAATHRITEGEKLLIDRCCVQGGWNYGNSNVLGKNLPGYVPVTSIALLALQDRRALPEVVRSLAFLERQAVAEPSGVALSLALMCLRMYGRPTQAVEAALVAQWQRTGFLDNLCAMAMALCALAPSARLDARMRVPDGQ